MSGPPAPETTPARARVRDLLHLGALLAAERFKGKRADAGAAAQRWAASLANDAPSARRDIDLALRTPIEIVRDREHSDRLLAAEPEPDAYHAGTMKAAGMGFLAPGALTIASGEQWRRLRRFNEAVLGPGSVHRLAPLVLAHARAAFAAPIRQPSDVVDDMGRAMVRIVLGEVDRAFDPAGDVAHLFRLIQNPLKRKALGFLNQRRRARVYALIAERWERAATTPGQPETLLAVAVDHIDDLDRDAIIQQVPHWMFTFTGSGAALLLRTLCMITSRPEVERRVLAELQQSGSPDRVESIDRLHYLNACLLETGRLFPPVTRTFHRCTEPGQPPREYAHYFPLLQRDDALGPTVHEFRPERWLEPELDEPARASNLFLRGPRACPGADLILFVCRAILARQIGELGVSASQARLAADPLPISFPTVAGPFTAGGTAGRAAR